MITDKWVTSSVSQSPCDCKSSSFFIREAHRSHASAYTVQGHCCNRIGHFKFLKTQKAKLFITHQVFFVFTHLLSPVKVHVVATVKHFTTVLHVVKLVSSAFGAEFSPSSAAFSKEAAEPSSIHPASANTNTPWFSQSKQTYQLKGPLASHFTELTSCL